MTGSKWSLDEVPTMVQLGPGESRLGLDSGPSGAPIVSRQRPGSVPKESQSKHDGVPNRSQ
jgi:hypothetical protein